MARQRRSVFDDDFKKDAVKLVEKLGSQKEAAEKLGVSEVNIHNWCRKFGKMTTKKTTQIKVSPEVKYRNNDGLIERISVLEKENDLLRSVLAALTKDYLDKTS